VPRTCLNLVLLKRIHLGEVTDLDVDDFDKAAVLSGAREVPLAFHAAVIFATRLVQFHSHPGAWFEVDVSYKIWKFII
jgi:hypothetical protein